MEKSSEAEAKRKNLSNRRELDQRMDVLERKIAELRVLFEQYFVDVIPQTPLDLQKEVTLLIKELLKSPFKNSATRFRLRTLVTRYQTYHTYWTRVLQQREDGTYSRDLFKADLRDKMQNESQLDRTQEGKAERGFQELFKVYEGALKKVGSNTSVINYEGFKKSLISRAKELKEKHGIKQLKYKVVVQNGKVSLKAQIIDKK